MARQVKCLTRPPLGGCACGGKHTAAAGLTLHWLFCQASGLNAKPGGGVFPIVDIHRHQKAVALYPGSFDPLTNGHIDLIDRAARLFDNLILAVVHNPAKNPLFSVEERIDMLREVAGKYENVEVDSFEGLLVNYAQRRNARVLIRGIRAISDYEYELQMALMNRRLQPELETVFLMASEAYSFVSSRMVKEVFALGGDVSGLVPDTTLERLRARIKKS